MRQQKFTAIAAAGLVATLFVVVQTNAAELKIGEKHDAEPASVLESEAKAAQLIEQAILSAQAGDRDRRNRLLDQAIDIVPNSKLVRWHAGQVREREQWVTIDEAERAAADSTLLSQYRKRRDAAEMTVTAQLDLARWCRQHELNQEAKAHLTKVLELDPDNVSAVQHLGLELYDGIWMNKEQIAKLVQKAESAAEALKFWKPEFLALRRELSSADTEEAARKKLRDNLELEAIPALEEVFSRDSRRWALEAIAALDAMPHQDASEALTRYAVLAESKEVRKSATDALKKRSWEDVVPVLLEGLRSPIQSDVELVNEGDRVRVRHKLSQEGAETDETKVSELRLGLANSNPYASQLIDRALSQALISAERSKDALAKINNAAGLLNEKIYDVLIDLTDAKIAPDPRAWWDWWLEYNDLLLSPGRPVYENEVVYQYDLPLYVPYSRPYSTVPIPHVSAVKQDYPERRPRRKRVLRSWSTGPWAGRREVTYASCFAKGTMVWTQTGPRTIEGIRAGDRVLSQDPDSGELAYKAVLDTTLRVGRRMLTLDLGSETITSTRGHEYWVMGEGWKIPKEMKVGEALYGVSGGAVVKAIEEAPRADAYNLVVADFNTYFVGENRLLVHDNTRAEPTERFVPGFEPKKLETAVASK